MKIYHTQVNHLNNPIGFRMNRTVFSWKVKEAEGKKQSYARIRVASDAKMEQILFDSGKDADASSLGYEVKLALAPRTRYYWTVEAGSDTEETAVSEVQFFETAKMNNILTDNGMNDLAYELLLNEEFPGWLYEVKLGATTVWERWNSLLPDGTISGISMNSMNHYSYGSVLEWMFRHVAGINTKEEYPGVKSLTFEPTLNWELGHVNARYDSPSGEYKMSWKLTDKKHVTMEFDVPVDCTANAVLPLVAEPETEKLDGILGQKTLDGAYLLTAGHYEVSYELSRSVGKETGNAFAGFSD